jgi:hypothetical protein
MTSTARIARALRVVVDVVAVGFVESSKTHRASRLRTVRLRGLDAPNYDYDREGSKSQRATAKNQGATSKPRNRASTRNPLRPRVQKTYQTSDTGKNNPARNPKSWQGTRRRRLASRIIQKRRLIPRHTEVNCVTVGDGAAPDVT